MPFNATLHKPSSSTVFKTLCIISFLAAPIALLIWLPLFHHDLTRVSAFEGTPIGGNLSLNAAKAIDFASSAIFAPLLFFLLNYTWFTNAQVALGDERKRQGRGAPLSAFVEASQTSGGSYDLVKLKKLLGSRSWQMGGMAVMALLAAVAQSTLSNIIAYEAFVEAGGQAQGMRLRMLVDPTLNTAVFNPSISGVEIPGFNESGPFDLTGLFVDFVTANSRTDNLTAGAYLAPNVTVQQLGNVNGSAQRLDNVPAIRGTIDCQAYSPRSIQLAVSNARTINAIYIDDDQPDLSASQYTGPGYLAEFPSSASITEQTTQDYIDYMAYNSDSTEVFFGVLGTNSSIGSTTQSPFGTIGVTEYNTSLIGMSETSQAPRDYTAYTWGMKCRVSEGAATLTLSRTNSTSSNWLQSNPQFDSSNEAVRSSFLSAFAIIGSSLQRPLQTNWSTLGAVAASSALTCNYKSDVINNTNFCNGVAATDTLDWQRVANNILYLSMEARRLTYDSATQLQDRAPADAFATVTARVDTFRYRITYVPALLLVGLICVMIVASIAFAMTLQSRKSVSEQAFRKVDGLRLIIDAVNGLEPGDRYTWETLAALKASELDNWAQNHVVRYEVDYGNGGARAEWGVGKRKIVLRAVDQDDIRGDGGGLALRRVKARDARTPLRQHDSDDETSLQ